MKQILGKYLFGASILLLAVPTSTLAQNEKNRKDVEQIIITRTADNTERTVIEITGDAIIVNGKNAKELKGNITVHRNRVRDVDALVTTRPALAPRGGSTYSFDMNEDGMRFYQADSNRAMLGVVTAEDEKGARINSVSKESGAEKAGLKRGDIITRINDTRIKDAGDVSEVVRKHKPGDKVNINYLRDGKEQKAVAELSRWKGLRVDANGENFRVMVPNSATPMPMNPRFDFRDFSMERSERPKLGISVQDSEDGNGVLVQEVEAESNAAKAGIRKGDVITHFNGEAVNGVDELRRRMNEGRDKITVPVKLQRNGKEQSIDVKMPRKLKSADL